MIIHQPGMIHKDGYAVAWARVELAKPRANFPDYIWYRVPEAYSQYLSVQSDAFLAPSLIAAMHFGENVDVRGVVSPRLAYSLEEYQFALQFQLKKQHLQHVAIHYNMLQAWDAKPRGVAATFSGGVDSFFTLMKHLPSYQSIPDYQVTHAVFIQNFDILSWNINRYWELCSRYRNFLMELGVELIPMETNLVTTIVPWLKYNYFYGPVLAGCGMALGGLLKRFYISSSRDYDQLSKEAISSNPLSDGLLSTETLDIIHFGAAYQRVEKIEALSDWKPAQDHLRVCGKSELMEQEINCSYCEKCTRTMVPLYALGKAEKFKTFTKPFRSNRDTLRWARKFNLGRDLYVAEIFPFARKHKPDLGPWLRAAVLLGSIRSGLLSLVPGFIKIWLRRYGYFIDSLGEMNAFENIAVIDLIRSVVSSK
jgi:hypothetical protein